MIYAYTIPDRSEPSGKRIITKNVYTDMPDSKSAINKFHDRYDFRPMEDMSLVSIQPLEDHTELKNAEIM